MTWKLENPLLDILNTVCMYIKWIKASWAYRRVLFENILFMIFSPRFYNKYYYAQGGLLIPIQNMYFLKHEWHPIGENLYCTIVHKIGQKLNIQRCQMEKIWKKRIKIKRAENLVPNRAKNLSFIIHLKREQKSQMSIQYICTHIFDGHFW